MQRAVVSSGVNAHKIALIETALAISLWAVSFVFIKIALREVSPITLITLRFSMAAFLLGLLSAANGEMKHIYRSGLVRSALVGAAGMIVQQMLYVKGQVTTEAGTAAFISASSPAFIVLLAALFLHERLQGWKVVGVLMATLGAAIISTGGDLSLLRQGHIADPGSLWVLASAVMWAVYTILNRFSVQDQPPALTTSGIMLVGMIFMLPLFITSQGWQELARLSVPGWESLAFVGVFGTAGAYWMYSRALKRSTASSLAAVQNLEPLLAVSAAALIINEPITAALLVGGAAILIGVYLAER
jgi:drug/metabolite transporter (DMT)-like permease